MLSWRFAFSVLVLIALAAPARAAPDEDLLGKKQGYPLGTPATWFYDERVRVGSFSHLDDILPHDTMRRSAAPSLTASAATDMH